NDNTEIYKEILLKYFDETTTNTIIENNGIVNTQNIYFYKWEELFKDFYQNFIDVFDPFVLNLYQSGSAYYILYFLRNNLPKNRETTLLAIKLMLKVEKSAMTTISEVKSRFYDREFETDSVIKDNIDLFPIDELIDEVRKNSNRVAAELLLNLDYNKYEELVKDIFYSMSFIGARDQYYYNGTLNLIKDDAFKKSIIKGNIEKFIKDNSTGVKIKSEFVQNIIDFIETGKKVADFEEMIEEFNKKASNTSSGFQNLINYSFDYDKNDLFYKRVNYVSTLLNFNNTIPFLIRDYLKSKKDNLKLSDFYVLNSELDIPIKYIHRYIVQSIANKRNDYKAEFKSFIWNVLDKSFDDISLMVEDYAVELLEQVIPYFYMFDREKTYQLILKLSSTTSKSIRRYLVQVASEYRSESNIEDYKKMLDVKKKPIKEFAILVLTEINVENIEQILKSMYEKESSDAFRKVINECLVEISKKTLNSTTQIVDGKIEESISTDLTKTSLIESSKTFVVKNGKEPVVGVSFLNVSTLPKLLWKEDETEAPLTVVYNFINSFAMTKSHIPSVMGREMGTLFEENSLIEFTKEIHARWNGEAKTKWVFGFVSAFGGNYFVPILKKQISQLGDAGRGQVATNIVESLAMIGTSRALQIVDFISRKDKNKQVKNGAIKALEVASKELKLSKDELLDKIIPNFGFSSNGELELNYGPRKFNIKMTPEELFIFDESGKSLKSLPKPNGNDDQVLAKESENLFKEIKKEFKEQAKLQKERLENSLSTGRLWKKSDWIEFFTENPLMKKFAISLIWGVYVNGELKSTFRFNEDGSFSDINDDTTVVVSDLGSLTSESYSDITADAVTIPENSMISIVHPVELSKDEIDKWSTILSDYEIKQPFSQIDRVSFSIKDDDKDLEKVEDFQGYMITRISLKSRLLKENWSTGWVEDGGCFYFYQKTFPEAQITVKLDFLGDCMGGYDDTVEVPLYGLSFYNNLHKESIKLSEVPKRVFSEVYKTVKTIATSGSGFNENWKKCSW
ncbi:DUF4132 domain-containing protein, partial [bacterium]|nr:DUF4132 domain-containing protein [bacterium]